MAIARSQYQRTLQLSFPFGRTALSAAIVLIVILALTEALSRTEYARDHLVVPDVTNHPHLGIKLNLYEQRLAEGPIDCAFVGSSMVNSGIDPDAISEAYYEATGDAIRCFNFGVDNLDVVGAANLSEILINRYHPRAVIFPLAFRDFVSVNSFQVNSAWALYQIGEFSLLGWLANYSRAYQYYETYKFQLINTGYLARQTFAQRVSPYGFLSLKRVADVSGPPGVGERYDSFEMESSEVAALDRLLMLQRPGTRIILIELPLPDTGLGLMPRGEEDYKNFLNTIVTYTNSRDVLFLQSRDSLDIPEDGWFNYLHLNQTGAQAFSRWIGQALAESSEWR